MGLVHWLQLSYTLYEVYQAYQFEEGHFSRRNQSTPPKIILSATLGGILVKRLVIKAIRVTFFIKACRFRAFPPPLVFQFLHIFQGQVTHQLQLYPQLQITYCLNLATHLKVLRSVPNVLCSCPLNDSLVSFVIIVLTNEFYPLMLAHPCFRWLRSLRFLPWSITSL